MVFHNHHIPQQVKWDKTKIDFETKLFLKNLSDSSSRSSVMQNFERLENSLTSGLPNEVDFVFNTILILSNDDSYSFRINGTNTRLISLILANIGFFGDDSNNYRRLYDQWRIHSKRNFVKFWHDTISTDNKEILMLLPVIYNSCK
jgi:hypothetical protein